MHALRLFELNTTALILKNPEQRDERQIHCWPAWGKMNSLCNVVCSGHPLAGRWRVSDLVALTKPRVMMLAVFTALVGLSSAPVRLDHLTTIAEVIAIAGGAGAAGMLNMWYDADIDPLMSRTAMRPISRGKVSRFEALAFGLVLSAFAVWSLPWRRISWQPHCWPAPSSFMLSCTQRG